MTIRVSGRVDVERPADVVFPYLADPHNQHEWTPNFLEMLNGPDGPPRVGMRYRGRLRLFGAVNFVIDQFEPGRSFRVDTDPPGGRLTHRFEVGPRGSGSRISHLVEFEPSGVVRIAAPLFAVAPRLMVLDLNRCMKRVLGALFKIRLVAPRGGEHPDGQILGSDDSVTRVVRRPERLHENALDVLGEACTLIALGGGVQRDRRLNRGHRQPALPEHNACGAGLSAQQREEKLPLGDADGSTVPRSAR